MAMNWIKELLDREDVKIALGGLFIALALGIYSMIVEKR
jgi:hypothetical protein